MPIVNSLAKAKFDVNVSAFDVAEVGKPCQKRVTSAN
jgi:hypothetical protein